MQLAKRKAALLALALASIASTASASRTDVDGAPLRVARVEQVELEAPRFALALERSVVLELPQLVDASLEPHPGLAYRESKPHVWGFDLGLETQPQEPQRFELEIASGAWETGLLYARNRFYDPELGRFISADPMGYVDGPSMYGFAGNDPINGSDPFGLQEEKEKPIGNRIVDWVSEKWNESWLGEKVAQGFAAVDDFARGNREKVEQAVREDFGPTPQMDPFLAELANEAGMDPADLDKGTKLRTGVGETAAEVSGTIAESATREGTYLLTGSIAGRGVGLIDDALSRTGRTRHIDLDPAPNGSYLVEFDSGMSYAGKGSTSRARRSARQHSREHSDPVRSIDHTVASTDEEAFKQEAARLRALGGPEDPSNYNKINSPGRNLLEDDPAPD